MSLSFRPFVKAALFFAAVSLTALTACTDEVVRLPDARSKTFNYGFNQGQLVFGAPYTGTHPKTLMATMTITDNLDSTSTISVMLLNPLANQRYLIHAHDALDSPIYHYNVRPNARLFSQTVTGNGISVSAKQIAYMPYDSILNKYDGYLMVHDTTVTVDTDTSSANTFLILGTFAR